MSVELCGFVEAAKKEKESGVLARATPFRDRFRDRFRDKGRRHAAMHFKVSGAWRGMTPTSRGAMP